MFNFSAAINALIIFTCLTGFIQCDASAECPLKAPKYPDESVKVPVYFDQAEVPQDQKEPYVLYDKTAGRLRAFEFNPDHGYWHEWHQQICWLVDVTVDGRAEEAGAPAGWYKYEMNLAVAVDSRLPLDSFMVTSGPGDKMEVNAQDNKIRTKLKNLQKDGLRLRIFHDGNPLAPLVASGGNRLVRYSSPMLPGPALCYAGGSDCCIYPAKENRRIPFEGEDEMLNGEKLFSALPRLVPGSARGVSVTPVYEPGWDSWDHLRRMLEDLPLFREGCWVDDMAVLEPVRAALSEALTARTTRPSIPAAVAALEKALAAAGEMHENNTLRPGGWDIMRLNINHLLSKLKKLDS